MSTIQISDQTFIAAPGSVVGPFVGDAGRWQRWWPQLRMTVTQDRGAAGVRWRVQGPLDGTMEIWLEPMLDGVVLHYFLHAEPVTPAENVAAVIRQWRVRGKEMAFAVKAETERGRVWGEAAAGAR